MSTSPSDEAQLKVMHGFLAALGLGVIVMVVLSLPELKRYIKISNM